MPFILSKSAGGGLRRCVYLDGGADRHSPCYAAIKVSNLSDFRAEKAQSKAVRVQRRRASRASLGDSELVGDSFGGEG